MKALTVYQPWASLIIEGAKPYEFRRWDYSARFPSLVGQRIAIHAAARAMKADEVFDVLDRIKDGETALDIEKATPVLNLILDTARDNEKRAARCLPISAVLGTATLGKPQRAFDLFRDKVADSDRIDQHIFAWPLTDIARFDQPVPYRGAQGFWSFQEALGA